MKTQTMMGIILIVLGVLALAYQGFTYTTREKAVDIGPVEITTESTRRVPLPPIVGAVSLVGGVVLLAMGSRKP